VREYERACPFCGAPFSIPKARAYERFYDPRLSRAARLALGATLFASSGPACEAGRLAASPAPGGASGDAATGPAPERSVEEAGAEAGDGATDAVVQAQPRQIPIYGSSSVVIVPAIHFRLGSAKIPASEEPTVRAVAETLKHHPELHVEVDGHADASEGAAGQRLSIQRGEHVRDALIKLGVDSNQLTTAGFGAERPLAPPDAGRSINPRVQFTVVSGT
jgi:outer membrane protein OmpA-like peptidoglycan-associated protein